MKLTFTKFQSEEKINFDLDNPVIIGRGPLFKCFEKRVSRSHGQVHLTPDGKVHLIALSSNPCFIMQNGLPPVIKLDKNDDKILHDGDYVGFLPDSFWYKVEFSKSESIVVDNSLTSTVRTSTATKSDSSLEPNTTQIINHNVADNSNECQPIISEAKIQTETIPEIMENIDEKTSLNESLEERLKSLKNTQKLPLYMYEIDDFPEEYSETNIKEIPSTSAEEKEEKSKNYSSEQDEDSTIKDGTICNVSKADSQSDGKFLTNCAEDNVESVNDCKIDVNSSELNKENIAHASKEVPVNENKEDLCGNQSTCTQPERRPICQYESNCYRKNLQHKRDYSHPGDSDFIPYENREPCRFGSSCHRRNKNHRTNYRHPKKNSPSDTPKSKRRKKAERHDASDDLADFINDESSDDLDFTNDGSSDEFIPSDSYATSSTSETEDF